MAKDKSLVIAVIGIIALAFVIGIIASAPHSIGRAVEGGSTGTYTSGYVYTAPELISKIKSINVLETSYKLTIPQSIIDLITSGGCIDNDGINYYRKSRISVANGEFEDTCVDSYKVKEFTCVLGTRLNPDYILTTESLSLIPIKGISKELFQALFNKIYSISLVLDGTTPSPRQITFSCPNGCLDGACKPGVKCGNGIIEYGEQCDGAQLGQQTCLTLGFNGGKLSCLNCQLVATGCIKKLA